MSTGQVLWRIFKWVVAIHVVVIILAVLAR